MRKYAFGDVSVPREETQYLKIKYPAGYPALPEVRRDRRASCSVATEPRAPCTQYDSVSSWSPHRFILRNICCVSAET